MKDGFKLRKVYIENYMMFHDFELNLVDQNDDALPVVVLAGINGTGKTSLLDYIAQFHKYIWKVRYEEDNKVFPEKRDNNFIELGISHQVKKLGYATFSISINDFTTIEPTPIWENYKNSIFYLPVFHDSIKDIEKKLLNLYINIAKELDSFKQALKKLQDFIADTFNGFELGFTIEDVDYATETVSLITRSGDQFSMNTLSTGEKTLLSKVFHLYMNQGQFKNKVILIDEPETSLHPEWQRRVLGIYENFAKLNNCQIIIATHSPHIIGSAKNEYLRVLRFNDEHRVECVSGLYAHGRDINWVLTQVMGATNTREVNILEKLSDIEKLLDQEAYEEAEERLDHLESVIGEHDSEIVRLRTILDFERD